MLIRLIRFIFVWKFFCIFLMQTRLVRLIRTYVQYWKNQVGYVMWRHLRLHCSACRFHTLPAYSRVSGDVCMIAILSKLCRKTLNNNDLNQVADQQFLLKQWFAAGVHSSRLRKPGSGRSSKEKYCTDITEVAVQVPFRPDFVRDFSYNCFGSARNCNDHCKIR